MGAQTNQPQQPSGKHGQPPTPFAGDRFQLARQGSNTPPMAPTNPALMGGGNPNPYSSSSWAGGSQYAPSGAGVGKKQVPPPAPGQPPGQGPGQNTIMPVPGAVPAPGATPPAGGVDHAANFGSLMKEDPFAARYYAENMAPEWYRQNQIGIARDYFGATPEWVNGGNGSAGWQPMNQWINDNSAGGGTWSQRGGNALDVVNPALYQRLRQMAGMK